MIGVRISPERFASILLEDYPTQNLRKNKNIHFIDVSPDSFKLVDMFPKERVIELFTDIDRGEKLLTVAGKIFSYEDIEHLKIIMSIFRLGRAAILDHQFQIA